MKTQTVATEPPTELMQNVSRLRAHFPYRICWGAFRPENPEDHFSGADYDKRKFNAKLRAGYVGFIL